MSQSSCFEIAQQAQFDAGELITQREVVGVVNCETPNAQHNITLLQPAERHIITALHIVSWKVGTTGYLSHEPSLMALAPTSLL